MIIGLEKSSPASLTNLSEGDIIIEFNGKDLSSSGELTRHLIGGDLINKPIKMKIIRQTKVMELNIVPVKRMAA